ncbi:MAG TPA: ABC transporter ATP-binding protein, partial [Geminicoccaceae bacterium]|nr:ABC transporter ATP-binding protein [Geminicoccaceae bacterium]
DLTLGALVAVIGAHKELYSPWKELLSHYQLTWDSQIKFEQVVAQFDPVGLRDETLQIAEPSEPISFTGELRAANVTLTSEDGQVILDGASFVVQLPARVAVLGPAGSGKEELLLVLANLIEPDAGRVLINHVDLNRLPEAVTGRQMTFVGYPAQIFAGTIAENLFFGLRHRPVRPRELEGLAAELSERERHEAERAGNSPFDPEADWIDYEAAGLSGPEDVVPAAVRVLTMVRLDRDVYHMGLRGTIDPEAQPEVAAAVLRARHAVRERLSDPRYSRLVEVFDVDRYNTNATLAENLLFGAPVDETFDIEHLAAHPYVQETLERAGIADTLVGVGLKLAATMVELFVDLPPDHEYFRQFSFISADDLPEYRALTTRADPSRLEALSRDDRQRLIALTFKLAPARHRLDLVDEDLQARVLEARRLFRENLPEELRGSVAFFDAERYTASASLQDNILFGKVAYGQPQATERIGQLITEVLNELGLHDRVVEVGLQAHTGVGGGRLSLPQRQKLALARAILKRPDVLLLYEATASLDPSEQQAILEALLEEFAERTVIWAVSRSDWAEKFDHVLVMRGGRVVEQGRYDELNRDGSALHEMVAAE